MKFIRLFLLLFAILGSQFAYTQSSDLEKKVNDLAELVTDVQVGKNVFNQKMIVNAEAPYRLQLEVTRVDSKGKEQRMDYLINLALFEPNLLRWEDGKDKIQVNLNSGNDPVVKALKDGELNGYEKEVSILASGIDNAREMESALKEIIPLAKESWETATALPESQDELKYWFTQNVVRVGQGDDSFDQSWENEEDHPNRVRLKQVDEGGRKSAEETFAWNMADVQLPSIEVSVRGKVVAVKMRTKNRDKFIHAEKDGELQNYVSEVSIRNEEVDQAQVLAYALRKLVPMAEEAEKAQMAEATMRVNALQGFQEGIIDLQVGDDAIAQKLEGDCAATYTQTVDNGKSVNKSVYGLDLADLHAASAEIEVKGKEVMVSVPTGERKKYISLEKDGEQQNFVDKISFAATDIPAAKQMKAYLKRSIDECPSEVAAKDWSWLQKAIVETGSDIDGYDQSVELMESDPCKWSFVITEDNGKKVSEERYELNLYDLDHARIDIEVKGKTVNLNLPTRRNDEIIKNFTNGEKLGYVKELSFRLPDIATAKIALTSLQGIVQSCSKD